MTKVTNKAGYPLLLADGTPMAPGEEVDVKDWAKVKEHHVTTAMLQSGQLQVGAGKSSESEDDVGEKASLLAQLRSLGIDANGNSKVETLRKKLEEAEAAQAAKVERDGLIEQLNAKNIQFEAGETNDKLKAKLAQAE